MRDTIIVLLVAFAFYFAITDAYWKGVDDGYIMHEEEENFYSCPLWEDELV